MTETTHQKRTYDVVKRCCDAGFAVIGLLLLAPLYVIIAAWIKLDSRGPALFTQKRFGRHKVYFKIYKFRSMWVSAPKDAATHTLQNADSHITRAGQFLRKSSLDELPQLINILKGEMSFVGPRPALYNQHDLVEERDKYSANNMRPGLTGWAQVNGRDELPIRLKAQLDGEYAKRVGVAMDARCLYMTVAAVLTNKGVREGEHTDE